MQSSSTVLFSQVCTECPGSDKLQNLLENLLEENATEHVAIKQWISTDRSTYETTVKPSDEFTDMLIAKLAALQPHSFVAVQQAM
jgi:hypothetical protein